MAENSSLPNTKFIGSFMVRYMLKEYEGHEFYVPKGIVRIIEKDRGGWYARFQRKGQLIINFKVYDDPDPHRSLALAEKKFLSELREHADNSPEFNRPRITHSVPTAIEGVCLSWNSYYRKGHQNKTHSLYAYFNYRKGVAGSPSTTKGIYISSLSCLNRQVLKKKLRIAYAYKLYSDYLESENRASELKKGFPSVEVLLNRIKGVRVRSVPINDIIDKFYENEERKTSTQSSLETVSP